MLMTCSSRWGETAGQATAPYALDAPTSNSMVGGNQ
jgi:hypothetical protein